MKANTDLTTDFEIDTAGMSSRPAKPAKRKRGGFKGKLAAGTAAVGTLATAGVAKAQGTAAQIIAPDTAGDPNLIQVFVGDVADFAGYGVTALIVYAGFRAIKRFI